MVEEKKLGMEVSHSTQKGEKKCVRIEFSILIVI